MINKVLKLLDQRQKKGFFYLIFLIFIGSLMEMLGIAIIIPLLNTTLNDNSSLFLFNDYVKNLTKKEIITFMCFSIIVIFFFKKTYIFLLKPAASNYLQYNVFY